MDFMMSTSGVDTVTAAAQRRQRRLCAYLRYARMSVATALAESTQTLLMPCWSLPLLLLEEAFKVFSQNREFFTGCSALSSRSLTLQLQVPDIHWRSLPCKPWGGGQQRHWRSRSWTLQSPRSGGEVAEVFKVHEQDRVQQQRTWSRSSKFQLAMEFFKVFAQARVPQLPHRVGCLQTQMQEFEGFFALFPGPKKRVEVTRQLSPRVLRCVSSSELSAHQMAPVGESDELEDERGDALDAATADLQRWRRGLGGEGAG